MDIYLNLGTGAFALNFDSEDQTPDWKTRFMLVNAAMQRPWPQRQMRRYDQMRKHGDFEFNELIELDGVELTISSTLPRDATLKVLELVANFLLEKVKSGESFEDDEPIVGDDDDDIDIEVSVEDDDGVDDEGLEEEEQADE